MFDFNLEIFIRKSLAAKTQASASELGIVLPAPIYFVDKADFWASVAPKLTRDDIEMTPAQFCVISVLAPFEDENPVVEGCLDAPLVTATYNFYIFHQYDETRADETDAPDDFLKKTLKGYNEFIKAILSLRQEFLGIQDILGVPSGTRVQTNSLTAGAYINERQPSKYFLKGDVFGHSINLQTKVNILTEVT